MSVPWIRLAARILERYEKEELVAFTTPWRRLVDDFADHLAGSAGKDDLGGLIGEWLLEKEGVDDVFTTDETLGIVVMETAKQVAEEPEPDPEPEPEPELDDDDDFDLGMMLGLAGGRRKRGGGGRSGLAMALGLGRGGGDREGDDGETDGGDSGDDDAGGSGGGRPGIPGDLMRELMAPIDPKELDRQVWLAQWSRQSFTPVTKKGDGPVGVSKFGGAAFLRRGESWPVCPQSDRPMHLFVQLDLAELPELMPHPHREGLVQLFYCTDTDSQGEVDHEAGQPFSSSMMARWLPAESLAEEAEPASNPTGAPAAVLIEWKDGPMELPVYPEEIPEPAPEGLAELEDEEYQPRKGDKLGGWPAWVQGPEVPKCPECGKPMEFLLQLDSNGLSNHKFGNNGTGYLFQCAHHPTEVAFGWSTADEV